MITDFRSCAFSAVDRRAGCGRQDEFADAKTI